MARKTFFRLLYWFRNTPWDSGISPPELYRFLENQPPGRSLDLGCGTGTNVITMAEYGWRAAGVDFVPRAIRIARRKSHQRGLAEKVAFLAGDVLSPNSFQGEYDLILDIGCFHGFSDQEARIYAQNVAKHLAVGGSLLLYAHLREGRDSEHGATEANLKMLEEYLALSWREDGEESSRPAAWLEFVKAA